MKERINLRASATMPQVIAANLMNCLLTTHRIEHNGLYAEVELTVNGKSVAFMTMAEAFGQVHADEVRRRAVAMLDADEGLARLRNALTSANLQVRAAISALPVPQEGGADAEVN
jgi:uncharacterized protein YabE (DUF348 family)